MSTNKFRTRIKMCGMTREQDVLSACKAGADAIGMVFYPPSPRAISLDQALVLSRSVSLLVDKVMLFVNPDAGYVREVISAAGAEVLQFHGDETPDFCQQFGKRYIKALRVKPGQNVNSELKRFQAADAILLDAFVEGVPGGTGKTFDWSLIPDCIQEKLFLAGGLKPSNVFEAVSQVRPYAVDVSGGIEESPGIKSASKIEAFAEAVRQADQTLSEISS